VFTWLSVVGPAFACVFGSASVGGPRGSAAPANLKELEHQFADPGAAYRIQFLLRTNDDARPEEIRWQVRQMKEKGCGGTFSYCDYYSQFKELRDARLESGGIKEEHKVSGLLGPVVLRIMR